jgi:hypothetical protein
MKSIERTPELAGEILKAWKASPELRAEFDNDITCYAAFRRAEAQGLVKTVKSTVVGGSRAKPDGVETKPAAKTKPAIKIKSASEMRADRTPAKHKAFFEGFRERMKQITVGKDA